MSPVERIGAVLRVRLVLGRVALVAIDRGVQRVYNKSPVRSFERLEQSPKQREADDFALVRCVRRRQDRLLGLAYMRAIKQLIGN